jgi:cell division protein FtsQ
MPAVVRGGRRANSASTPKRGGAAKASGGRARHPKRAAGGVPGKMAALGRLDLTPRAVVLSICAGAGVLALVLATGARAERIGQSFHSGMDAIATGMGLELRRVHITGASAEATPAIRRALDVKAGQPITGLDLATLQASVQAVGWVREARVVRLLPDTLIVDVVEHDRLAIWQTGGRVFVIDGEGNAIRGADAGRYPDLPLVVGNGADTAASEILGLLRERPRLMGRVDALVRVDGRRWDLRLREGGLIQLPAAGEEAALIQLDALDQRKRLLELGFERIDLRTEGQVAVRPGTGTRRNQSE